MAMGEWGSLLLESEKVVLVADVCPHGLGGTEARHVGCPMCEWQALGQSADFALHLSPGAWAWERRNRTKICSKKFEEVLKYVTILKALGAVRSLTKVAQEFSSLVFNSGRSLLASLTCMPFQNLELHRL